MLIPSAVEELLRYESPSQHTARLAPDDVELGGKLIRKRQAMIAVMAAGNRDPKRFPDPDRLDFAVPTTGTSLSGGPPTSVSVRRWPGSRGRSPFKPVTTIPEARTGGRTARVADNLVLRPKGVAASLRRETMSVATLPSTCDRPSLDDYEQIAQLESSNGLVSMPRGDWRNWAQNPLGQASATTGRSAGYWKMPQQIVGSLANMPSLYRFRGRERISANGRAWVVDPKYRGFALSLMDEYFNQPGVDLFVDPPLVRMHRRSARRPMPIGDLQKAAFRVSAFAVSRKRPCGSRGALGPLRPTPPGCGSG